MARTSAWAGALLGIGFMAAIDEVVFHQLLAWHHFYDRGTPELALFTDGLLHAVELVLMVWGFFLLLHLVRAQELLRPLAWAGFLLGAGGFQLFDGIIDHKVLRVHQIRYGVENLLAYDLAWNGFGLLLLIAGLVLLVRARRRAA